MILSLNFKNFYRNLINNNHHYLIICRIGLKSAIYRQPNVYSVVLFVLALIWKGKMTTQKKNEPKIGRTIWEDIQQGDFRKTLRRDYEDLKEFFLDDERKKRLQTMGRFKRWFLSSWWLLKSLFFNLTPVRRLLLVIAIILIFLWRQVIEISGTNIQSNTNLGFLGALVLLFILMLELKDKLLAKSELNEGRSIQFALMPESNPDVAGWDIWLFTRPANDVGGDLVDFLPLNETNYSVMLADVSGKGLGAALFMSKLQSTIRAIAPDFIELDKFAQKLNSIFYRDTVANRFASLLFIKLIADSDKIEFINAGHFPPMVIKNGKVDELPKGDPALGLSAKSGYSSQSLDFNDVDLLLVYSDGLTEAQNLTGEFYGEKRLRQFLANIKMNGAQQIGESILRNVDYFVGDAKATDDLSMIILRRQK